MFWRGRKEGLPGPCSSLDSYSCDAFQLHPPLIHSSSAAGLPVGRGLALVGPDSSTIPTTITKVCVLETGTQPFCFSLGFYWL